LIAGWSRGRLCFHVQASSQLKQTQKNIFSGWFLLSSWFWVMLCSLQYWSFIPVEKNCSLFSSLSFLFYLMKLSWMTDGKREPQIPDWGGGGSEVMEYLFMSVFW
jgi:hypothetical protein